MSNALLEGRDLSRRFAGRRRTVTAVDRVTLAIQAGTSLGLVGESGSGKTTVGRILAGLERPDSGQVLFDGALVATVEQGDRRERSSWRRFRRRVQYLFQDPAGALNPYHTVGVSIAAALGRLPRPERRRRLERLAERVGLDPALLGRYPHQLSGGQQQRVVIARALAVEPALLILDEPVSSLDVSVQAQILALLSDLRRDTGIGYLFISHDLAVVERLCERIAVMHAGRLVETAARESLLAAPRHPYTRSLIDAVPRFGPGR